MKAIVTNPGNLLKVQLDLDGKVNITLPGGKQVAGNLTDEELLVLAFRLHAITGGDVTVDGELFDFFKERLDHVETLEKQAITINEFREQDEARGKAFDALAAASKELQSRLTDCEGELTAARTELKDTRILLSEANEKLGLPPTKEEPATIPPPEGDTGFVVDNSHHDTTPPPAEPPTNPEASPAPITEVIPPAPAVVQEVKADAT